MAWPVGEGTAGFGGARHGVRLAWSGLVWRGEDHHCYTAPSGHGLEGKVWQGRAGLRSGLVGHGAARLLICHLTSGFAFLTRNP